ncbi:hypothetical protein NDU88_006855 [Pleurodeles waltl]|uniref:Secreted protein n=1 Tax=Pleurodeles waltl TaxID=8319 RepID=A0AAV7SQV0_PLEWA|nr:hypothetical protein NDU88_006855 [Pleurodeles waltl]
MNLLALRCCGVVGGACGLGLIRPPSHCTPNVLVPLQRRWEEQAQSRRASAPTDQPSNAAIQEVVYMA